MKLNLAKRLFGGNFNSHGVARERAAEGDLRIAASALLLEMSRIDGKFSELEKQRILSIIRQEYDLSDAEADSLLRKSEEELEESVDLWHFTNSINQNYSLEEKLHLIEVVWRIALTDGKLDEHEDYLAHKLANLLRLSHKQLIDAKLKVTTGAH